MIVDREQLRVEDIFALIAEQLDSYEPRPQQLELAHAIASAFSRKEIGIFEAGTGTGKSLAALVPAVLSGKKVVVSTATIALQEQYMHKDIPALKAILPFEIKAAIMKGRGNYLGLRRWQETLLEQQMDDDLVDWVNFTHTGDISELELVPPIDIWTEINSDADDCLRNKCPHFNECFYFESRKEAEKADILVVNHALLLADAGSRGNVLPEYEYLIVDEAHHFLDIARDAFSMSITNRGLRMLLARASKRLGAPHELIFDIESKGIEFFNFLAERYAVSKGRIREPLANASRLREGLDRLKKWLDQQEFEHILDVDLAREKAKLKAKAILSMVNGYLSCLELIESPTDDWVIWTERSEVSGSRIGVVASPLDVASLIQELVFAKTGLTASVWMSATLATGGDDPFKYFKRAMGIEDRVIQLSVSSPFDYKHQSVIYLPNSLPEPNHIDYILKASEEIETIIQACRGRAFVLFTSYTSMNKCFELVASRIPYECRRQGETSRRRLIEWFRSTPGAVLFGTASFWEGVSIEGDQLSCVIIDRIPFQVPDDPVYEAQCEALKESGEGSWFNDLALPHAIMRLKQGVGRLIRHRNDRGMVAILDPRLTRKQYGRAILSCLPPMTIIKFLGKGNALEDILDAL